MSLCPDVNLCSALITFPKAPLTKPAGANHGSDDASVNEYTPGINAEAGDQVVMPLVGSIACNHGQQQRTANEASIGATHKSNNSYADGSTIEGIMIAELIAQGITDVNAQANVLGMIYGESGFRATSETSYKNTNNQRIRDVFGGRISTGNPGDPGYMTEYLLQLLP